MSGQRKLGSTRVAYVLGFLLIGGGIAFGVARTFGWHFSWIFWELPIEVGASVISGFILVWWARSLPKERHKAGSGREIGQETVSMTVGVLTAVVAVFALVDAAAYNEEQRENAKADTPALASALEEIAALKREIAATKLAHTVSNATSASALTSNASATLSPSALPAKAKSPDNPRQP